MATSHLTHGSPGASHGDLHFDRLDPRALHAARTGIRVDTLLESKSFRIRKVSAGSTPHTVRFRSPTHTLGIFDQGSYIEGERRVNGSPIGTSGALDTGIDVIPANTDFHAVVWPNSNINVILISISDHVANPCRYGTPRADALASGTLLLSLASRVRELCQSGGIVDAGYLESVSTLLFHEVLAEQKALYLGEHARRSGGLSSRARRIVHDFLLDNLDEKIDLDEVARLVGLSRFHFSRAFKVTFGASPYKYLLKLRLGKASELLKQTRKPITDIALNVGFSTSSEFARAFRQEMKHTPREYRTLNHQEGRTGQLHS